MESESRTTRLSVLLPYPFDAAFTYEAAAPLPPGTLVRVPLGRRMVVGAVWDEAPDETIKTKKVAEILEFPPLPAQLMQFIDWVANYTLARRGDVLALALKESLLAPPPARAKKFSFPAADPALPPPAFSAAQAAAVAALQADVQARQFAVTLLDGVTGSGKTEVYLEAVAQVLRQGGQALVLLPEIALSVQFFQRFERRFGAPPAVWHSELTPALRRETLRALATRQSKWWWGHARRCSCPSRTCN